MTTSLKYFVALIISAAGTVFIPAAIMIAGEVKIGYLFLFVFLFVDLCIVALMVGSLIAEEDIEDKLVCPHCGSERVSNNPCPNCGSTEDPIKKK